MSSGKLFRCLLAIRVRERSQLGNFAPGGLRLEQLDKFAYSENRRAGEQFSLEALTLNLSGF